MKCKLPILTQQVTCEQTVNFASSAASDEIDEVDDVAGGQSAGILRRGTECCLSRDLGLLSFSCDCAVQVTKCMILF